MSGRPKNQHWVPRFYLKHFATLDTRSTANPKVWLIDKQGEISEPRLASTQKICGQRYLYTPENQDGNRDWSFEEYLGRLEDAASNYWDRLANGQLDLSDPEHRDQVAEFLAALHLRNKLIFEVVKGIMGNRDALFGGPKPTGQLRYLEAHEEKPDPTHPGRYFVQSTKNNLPRVTKTFASYRWRILQCNEEVLVTSDAPVTFVNSVRRRSGPGSKEAAAMFSVSPSTLLYIASKGVGPDTEYRDVKPDFLRRMNPVIAHFAQRFVIVGADLSNAQNIHFS